MLCSMILSTIITVRIITVSVCLVTSVAAGRRGDDAADLDVPCRISSSRVGGCRPNIRLIRSRSLFEVSVSRWFFLGEEVLVFWVIDGGSRC